jgi:hypothetical protein
VNLLALIAADPNVDPAFSDALTRRESRRFLEQPVAPTGFNEPTDLSEIEDPEDRPYSWPDAPRTGFL